MATADVEHVLVVPTQLFHDIVYIQGFTHDVEKYLDRLLDAKNTSYRPRPDMEEDPSFKQLIPYVIFPIICPQENLRELNTKRAKPLWAARRGFAGFLLISLRFSCGNIIGNII